MAVSAVRQKIGIIGAAIAGPTFAVHVLSHPILRKLYEPVIYDQCADLQNRDAQTLVHTAGAAVALSPNSLYPLYQLGLKDAISERSTELTGVKLWRASCGAALQVGQDVRDAVPSDYKYLTSHRNIGWSQELGTSMRVIERRHLQSLLLDRVARLGGEIVWNKKLESLESLGSGATKLTFNDSTNQVVDLLVGADGGWSEVRRHILRARNKTTAAKAWAPDFMGATGFYGISSRIDGSLEGDGVDSTDTHGIWLDQGNLSSSPLPNGRMRWDLQIPEKVPPDFPTAPASGPPDPQSTVDAGWESKIAPGVYSRSSTIEILHRYASVWHPVTGTFGRLLAASDRIIRSPLRQRLWGEKEIQVRNSVLIGDASRLMLPSSGQGSSFAIEDATILTNSLLNNPPAALDGGGFRNALEDYAKVRVPRSKKMVRAAYWIGLIGLGETWYWRWLRDFSTAWTPASDDLKESGKETLNWPLDVRPLVKLNDESLYDEMVKDEPGGVEV